MIYFGVGEKVRCTTGEGDTLIEGNIYTVNEEYTTINFISLNGVGGAWLHSRFERVEPFDEELFTI